mmetsp:Transcript_110835/g.220444  ORF Transcript_110835/g.220444 Transcript_110835/m.220444 type:complete len:354 (+) Transcript_110835:82-1143(+)
MTGKNTGRGQSDEAPWQQLRLRSRSVRRHAWTPDMQYRPLSGRTAESKYGLSSDKNEAMEEYKMEEDVPAQLMLECRFKVMEAAVQQQEGLAVQLAEESQAATKAAEEIKTELKSLDNERKLLVGRLQAASIAGQKALKEASEVAQQEARATAKKQHVEARAKLSQLQDIRTKTLEAFACRDGKLGVLAATVLKSEKQLEEANTNAMETAKKNLMETQVQQSKHQALSTTLQLVVTVRKPARLFVTSPDIAELAGEYRLLPDLVSNRPAYVCRGSNNEVQQTVYLFRCEGEKRFAWTFGRQLPFAGKESSSAEVSRSILAQNSQRAWTALPDELFSKWQAGASTVSVTISAEF